jgi:hypothetical protein
VIVDSENIIQDIGPPGSDRPVASEPPRTSGPPPDDDGWKRSDKNGRQYYNPTPGQRGARVIYRQGQETLAQAIARDAEEQRQTARDKRPHKRTRPKLPEPPRGVDLKQLETTLAEALKAPAMVCASFGDEWGAEHFNLSGPHLARNLVLASEHNPWLRRKLEEAATGEDAMMMVVSLVGVGGALFAYVVPPIVYYFNLPAPKKTREMFGIPDRKQPPPPYAADGQGAPPPAYPYSEAAEAA